MTNEQSIIKLQEEANKLKKEYNSILKNILNKKQKGKIKVNDILNAYETGNKYFNFYEKFVGESELLGGHKTDKWLISFAEDCATILKNYIEHINFIKSWQKTFQNIEVNPSKCSMSNLQRMIVEYLDKDKTKEVRKKFEKNNLPICGFEYKKSLKQQWKELSLSGKIGIIGSFASIIGLALYFLPIDSKSDNITANEHSTVIKNNYGIINYGNIDNSKIKISNFIDNKLSKLNISKSNPNQKDINAEIAILGVSKKINQQNLSIEQKNENCKIKANFLYKQFDYNLKIMNNLCEKIFKIKN